MMSYATWFAVGIGVAVAIGLFVKALMKMGALLLHLNSRQVPRYVKAARD